MSKSQSKKAAQNHTKLDEDTIQSVQNASFETLSKHINSPFNLLTVEFEREMGEWYLRVYITKENERVSLDDCETVTRDIDPVVDEMTETMPIFKDFPFHFEVSSPGLFKPLKSQREFDYYQGHAIQINTYAENDKKREMPENQITGTLVSSDMQNKTVTLTINNEESTQSITPQTEVTLYTDINVKDDTTDAEELNTV